jgi:UDP-2,3-diacylglucosamine pyrophosphatase LpxH
VSGNARPTSALAVRSVFLSDVHLGSRRTRIKPLLNFLEQLQAEQIYFVGDFIDGWCLAGGWHWTDHHDRVIRRLTDLAESGTRIRYAPGNHDDFLRRSPCWDWLRSSGLEVQDEFVHECVDGRRFLVLHGDQFDCQTLTSRWCHRVGSAMYTPLLALDHFINRYIDRRGGRRFPLTMEVKRFVGRVGHFIREFEERAAAHAVERACQGVICGHIHVPNMRSWNETIYVNLGDWLENCTSLVEHADGRLELMQHDGTLPWHASRTVRRFTARDSGEIDRPPSRIQAPRDRFVHAATHVLAPHSTAIQRTDALHPIAISKPI